MGKLLLVLSLFGIILLLIVSMVDPNNPAVWLASTAPKYTLLRLGLVAALASLLFFNPPSNVYLRSIVMISALGFAGWSLNGLYQNQMQLLDSFALLQASVASTVVTLETKAAAAPALNLQRFSLHNLYSSASEYLQQHLRPHVPTYR